MKQWIVYRLVFGQWDEVQRLDGSLSRQDVLRLFDGSEGQKNYGAIKVRRDG